MLLRERFPRLTHDEYVRYEQDDEELQPTIARWRYDFTRPPSDRFNRDARKSFVDGFLAAIKAGRFQNDPPRSTDLTQVKITAAFNAHITYTRKLYNRKDETREDRDKRLKAYAARARMSTVCGTPVVNSRLLFCLLASTVSSDSYRELGRVQEAQRPSIRAVPW